MKYEAALLRTLDFSRRRDAVDEQFRKLWPLVYDSARADSVRRTGGEEATAAHIKVAALLFEAWYRSIYYQKEHYGGTMIIHGNKTVLCWTRLLCSQFLGMRDVEHQHWDAENLSSMMRADKEARNLGVRSVLFYNLPFEGIMSWDLNNLMSACSVEDSLFFSTVPYTRWRVRATGDGSVIDLAKRVDIANVSSILLRARNQ